MNIVNKFKKSDKYTKYSILIIILFSVIVISLASIYHVSGDGCWHVSAGKFMAANQKIPSLEPLGRNEPFWSPPMYHFIVALVYYIFSAFDHNLANFAVKFVSPIFGILSIIFSFLIIKKLFNSKTAFYSMIFLCFIPIMIDYSVLSYVESTLLFFAVLSIYFLVNDKLILSGVSAGFAILSKYNGAFILPLLVYILFKTNKRKDFYRKSAIVMSLSLLVSTPWLIRNWMLLGNPVWPFLNFIFNGLELNSFSAAKVSNLIDINLPIATYLGIFGVPDGNYALFSSLHVPYLKILLAVWLIGTLLFMLPLLLGFFGKANKNSKFLTVWILSYLALFLLYAMNVGFSVSRIILPAFPAFAVFWALGFSKLSTKNNRLITPLIVLIALGFIMTLSVKFHYAAKSWDSYREDFEWVRLNTAPDSVFIAEGQCIPYNIERTSLYLTDANIKKADYIWVNQNFNLDIRSVLTDEKLRAVRSKNYEIAHENKKTGTVVYYAGQ